MKQKYSIEFDSAAEMENALHAIKNYHPNPVMTGEQLVFGSNAIDCVKRLRESFSLGLWEAKKIYDFACMVTSKRQHARTIAMVNLLEQELDEERRKPTWLTRIF